MKCVHLRRTVQMKSVDRLLHQAIGISAVPLVLTQVFHPPIR